MTSTAYLDALEILFGHATPAEARVYVRVRGELPADARLIGTVRGPHSHYQKTLQAEVPLVDRGPGDGLLAEALILDPCFWTPGSPQLYRLEVELVAAGQTLSCSERWFGLRHLGVVDGRIRWDHEAFVLRAMRTTEPPLEELPNWHDDQWGAVVSRASDVYCEEASRLGVALVAEVAGSAEQCVDELRRLAQWPCAMLAIVDCSDALPQEVSKLGLLLAQRRSSPAEVMADWASVAVFAAGDVPEQTSCAIMIETANPSSDRNTAAEQLAAVEHSAACGYLL